MGLSKNGHPKQSVGHRLRALQLVKKNFPFSAYGCTLKSWKGGTCLTQADVSFERSPYDEVMCWRDSLLLKSCPTVVKTSHVVEAQLFFQELTVDASLGPSPQSLRSRTVKKS